MLSRWFPRRTAGRRPTPARLTLTALEGRDVPAFALDITASAVTLDPGQATQLSAAVTDPPGMGYALAWDFGDGSTSYDWSPTRWYYQRGTYTVTATATDYDTGASVSDSVAITVNPWPDLTASVTATPDAVDPWESVAFAATPAGGSGSWSLAWDFGDGSTSYDWSPTHSYYQPGTYTATVTVTDYNANTSATATVPITVNPWPPVVVTATVDPGVHRPNRSVNFQGTATGGSGSLSYQWAFGDGSTSTELNPSHTYSRGGEYTATLTVTDNYAGTTRP